MLRGVSGGLITEMSYDDFMETYGRIRSTSDSSRKFEDRKSEESSSLTDSKATTVEFPQKKCNKSDINNTENVQLCEININRRISRERMDSTDSVSTKSETRRRSSKFHNMASKFSRKSFRLLKKRSSEDNPATPTRGRSQSTTPTRWNPFRRSQSVSRISSACHGTSSTTKVDSDQSPVTSPITSPLREKKPVLRRSTSYSPIASKTKKPSRDAILKRRSLNPLITESRKHISPSEEIDNTTIKTPDEKAIPSPQKPLQRPTFLPILPASPSPKPYTPEYEVVKKYDAIGEEERMRAIAVVTLLKRRRNSLKLKCNQFERDLASEELDKGQLKAVRSRLKHMKKKLNVVEQCVSEQEELTKVSTAKLHLRMNLELYQLDLLREEQRCHESCSPSPREEDLPLKDPFASATSRKTLRSSGETCAFDDTSSVTSLENKELRQLFPCGRPPSSPYCYNNRSRGNHVKSHSDGSPRNGFNKDRSSSIDCAVTSDCDSGFGNGDALSRSDINLNRLLSKSAESITSTSSPDTLYHSASNLDSISPSEKSGLSCFSPTSTSSSEQSLHSCHDIFIDKTLKNNRENSNYEVDPAVLATIEDFEKFAERTRRRLSRNGKLVPLKKGT